MKKLLLLKRVAMTLLIVLACSSQALARWVGNSAINVNGTWYYAGNSSMSWCSGGSFDGATFENVNSLVIGGQSQVYDNGTDWEGGTMTMQYMLDNDPSTIQSITLTYFKKEGNNMYFESRNGDDFITTNVNIAGLDPNITHTIDVWFYSEDAYDKKDNTHNYSATFTIPKTQTVSVGTSGKGTYSSAFNLDFTSTSNISAYTVSALSSTSATLTKVTQEVPAETGLIIMGAPSASESVSVVTSSTSVGTNYLKASVTGKTVGDEETYVLKSGEFHPAEAGTIPANKAYLLTSDVPSGARSLALVFNETTGISKTQVADDLISKDFYNLAGQRVSHPTKGIYIVNGKKVIIK